MAKKRLKAFIDLEVCLPDGYGLEDLLRDAEYNARNTFLPDEVKNIQIVDIGELTTVDMSQANPVCYAVIEYMGDIDNKWHTCDLRRVDEKETNRETPDSLCRFYSKLDTRRYRGRYGWMVLEPAEECAVYRDGEIQKTDKNE